jgi:hypothetical protein
MNKVLERISVLIVVFLTISMQLFAGNPDRTGQSGASELLVNPWARSSGWNSVNYSSVKGIEAMRLNVGGLTFVEKTSVGFARTEYLTGSGMNLNAFGFAQKMGDGALGISFMTVGFGEIDVTTTAQPEGGLGKFKPQYLNIGIAYSHSFADFIHGGVLVRIISEGIANVTATGIAIDAGLVYTTGSDTYPEQFKFGVSLRNVGTPMTFRGDGLNFRTDVLTGTYQQTASQLTAQFELPTQLNIGFSYDFYFQSRHRLTFAASFSSNAFYKDQFGAGLEYAMKINNRELFLLRAGYKYEQGIFSTTERTNAHTGFGAGFTVDIPFKKGEKTPGMKLDYSYRPSNPFTGSHSIGLFFDI